MQKSLLVVSRYAPNLCSDKYLCAQNTVIIVILLQYIDVSDNIIIILRSYVKFSSSAVLQEEGANVTANALHPGTMDTGFGKNEASFKILTGILLFYTTWLHMNPKSLVTFKTCSGWSGERSSTVFEWKCYSEFFHLYNLAKELIPSSTGFWFCRLGQTGASVPVDNQGMSFELWIVSEIWSSRLFEFAFCCRSFLYFSQKICEDYSTGKVCLYTTNLVMSVHVEISTNRWGYTSPILILLMWFESDVATLIYVPET